MNCNDYLQNLIKSIPDKPGVYLMKNILSEVIYVGKAISLKKRVRQYFSNNVKDIKVLAMVSNIDDIEYIVTNNEMEALMLENNLIKQNKPFYNILLRDDKSFPYIKITKEDYPKAIKTRNKLDHDGIFFGPFTDVMMMNRYLRDINELLQLRDCNRNIAKSIENKERPCLNYHIGICSAPCASRISKEGYNERVDAVVDFFKGNHTLLKKSYQTKMEDAVKELRFEDAAEYRDLLNHLQILSEKQNVSIRKYSSKQHYVSFDYDSERIIITVLIYEKGNLIAREFYDFDNYFKNYEEIFASFLMQYYTDNPDIPKEVYIEDISINIEAIEESLNKENDSKISIVIPKIGKKKEILQLAKNNSTEQIKLIELKSERKEKNSYYAIIELENLTGVKPIHAIESFDVSNISGADSVGVKIVFKDGKKSPSDYRKYRIQHHGKPDDYASTAHMIERRLLKGDLPDIILLDGGKGHVSTIKKLLEKMQIFVPVYGMYKNDRHQTEGLCDENQIFEVNKNSKLFRLLSEIQNEVHRFAINYHRKSREKTMLRSELDEISGIGEKRKLALLRAFGGMEGIKNASIEDLQSVDGMNARSAKAIVEYFQRKNEEHKE